ncbi:organic hydroperoxide resistance protein [Macrococcoides goetzii]|nr:organic hydroperoxide resistance protein [Macrococcus goetzii]TDM45611.1 organic hydroperoxide resistance protein [Macrococcus goetzii]
MDKVLYETTVISKGGRNGKVFSEDNTFYLDIESPKALGGKGTTESNPEQLFAAGYAACFNSALTLLLKKAGHTDIDPEVRGIAKLISDESDGGFKLAAELEVRIEGLDQATAESFVEKAHNFCPYSKALKESINIELSVTTD